jgi:tetratricopeptide (TPR) repeat protein
MSAQYGPTITSESTMAAILRMFLCIAVSSLSGVARAEPNESPSADGRDGEAARNLLHQAQRLLDAQYGARPNGGFRYTAGLAAALAEIGECDAAETTFSHIKLGDRFGDVHLRVFATGYARGGDLVRARQTIARIRDAERVYAIQRPLAWREAGKALAKAGHKRKAAEAFAEAVRSMSVATDYPSQDADFLAQVAEGQYRLGRADESLETFKLAVSRALADRMKSMRAIGLKKIAASQAKLELLSDSLATVDRMEPNEQSSGWFDIVNVEAEAGRLESAYRVAERITGNGVSKTWIVLAAADWLRQASELAEGAVIVENGPFAALRQIELVPGAVARRFNHCVIAAAQAKLKFLEDARRSFERAKLASHGQQPGMWRDSALSTLAAAQAKAGFPDDAMRTLAALPDDAVKWLDYVPVAVARARAGDLAGAERVVNINPLDASATRSYIAQTLLECGDLKSALRYGLMGSGWMEEILHDAARRLARPMAWKLSRMRCPAELEARVELLLRAEGCRRGSRQPTMMESDCNVC